MFESDSAVIKKIGIGDSNLLNQTITEVMNDTTIIAKDSFTNDINPIFFV